MRQSKYGYLRATTANTIDLCRSSVVCVRYPSAEMRRWLPSFGTYLIGIQKKGSRLMQLILSSKKVPSFDAIFSNTPIIRHHHATVELPMNLGLFSNKCYGNNQVQFRHLSNAVSRDGQIHLIDENGRNAGLVSFGVAKSLADEKGLELHLTRPVSHQHPHALYKLLSKKDIYERKKMKKLQQQTIMKNRQKLKELSMSTDIGEQDMIWKLNRLREFLMENDRVKLIINRKRRSKKDCSELLSKVVHYLKDYGEIDGNTAETDFRLQCTLKPVLQVKNSKQ